MSSLKQCEVGSQPLLPCGLFCIHRSLTSLLDGIPFPVSLTDKTGCFVAVNDAFLKIHNLPAYEVLGQTPSLIAAKYFPQQLPDEIQHSTTGAGWSGRVRNRSREGREFTMYLLTRRLQTQHGERQLAVACPLGEENALLNVITDFLCSLIAWEPPSNLSPREQEAVGLFGQGNSQKEIAWRMHLAPSTVRVLLSRIRAKQKIFATE